MTTLLDLQRKLLGQSGRGIPFSPQYGVDEPGRELNIQQYVDSQIAAPAVAEVEPMMQRTDVASHLDSIGRIQANRNKWDARVGAFGGRMHWGDLPDITKQAKFQDEMINDEIISRLNNAILSGDIKDIEGAMSWFKSQAFPKHFEGNARKAATAMLDQIMQEEGMELSREKHVWAGETAQRQATEYAQSQLDRASTQAADLQSEKVQNKIGEMISGFSGIWAEDAGDYDKAEYREREIRYDVNQLEGYSESEKQTIFANVMEGLQAQTGQVGRFEVADQEMQVAQEKSRLQALQDAQTEEYRTAEATRRENQISNAGVQMLNELVAGGMDEQQATNQVIQQMSQWATDPNFLGLRESAGEWIPKEPVTVGTVEDAGMKASQPAGAVPLDAAGIRQAFLQQVGTRAEQASAVKLPGPMQWVVEQQQYLQPTGNPETDRLNVQRSVQFEKTKAGEDQALWHNFTRMAKEGIAIEKVATNLEMMGRIDRNAIVKEFEDTVLPHVENLLEGKKEEEADKVIEEFIQRKVNETNTYDMMIQYFLFPEMFAIGADR
jgi:hypothetical protein